MKYGWEPIDIVTRPHVGEKKLIIYRCKMSLIKIDNENEEEYYKTYASYSGNSYYFKHADRNICIMKLGCEYIGATLSCTLNLPTTPLKLRIADIKKYHLLKQKVRNFAPFCYYVNGDGYLYRRGALMEKYMWSPYADGWIFIEGRSKMPNVEGFQVVLDMKVVLMFLMIMRRNIKRYKFYARLIMSMI